MRSKLVTLLALVPALIAVTASPAGAAPPTVTEVAVDRTFNFAAGDACAFPLTVHNQGTRRTTTFYDASGNVTKTMIVLPTFTQTFTNATTGKSLWTPLAGPAIFEVNPDGTLTTRIPGNDGRIVVPGEGFVYGDVGLIVFTATDLLKLTGHYENPDLSLEAICASLA
jgi:hypothetical protein